MRREGQGTVLVLKFVKSCFDDGAIIVKEIGGWEAGWEERAGRAGRASYAEKGDEMVRSSCYCNAAWGSANGRVLDLIHGVG